VVDDLHVIAGVHAAQVGEELEAELRLIVEGGQDLGHVARRDAHLGLVVALPDGTQHALAEARFQAGLEGSIHA